MKITEFGPLLVFLGAYYYFDNMVYATAALVIALIIAMVWQYYNGKKIDNVQKWALGVAIVLGLMTVAFNDPTFIKMKPTFVYAAFGIAMFVSYYLKKPLLKMFLSKQIEMKDQIWMKMTIAWGIFFMICSAFNEYAWRNFSDDVWINIKVFGYTGATLLFLMMQMPFIMKNSKIDNE